MMKSGERRSGGGGSGGDSGANLLCKHSEWPIATPSRFFPFYLRYRSCSMCIYIYVCVCLYIKRERSQSKEILYIYYINTSASFKFSFDEENPNPVFVWERILAAYNISIAVHTQAVCSYEGRKNPFSGEWAREGLRGVSPVGGVSRLWQKGP